MQEPSLPLHILSRSCQLSAAVSSSSLIPISCPRHLYRGRRVRYLYQIVMFTCISCPALRNIASLLCQSPNFLGGPTKPGGKGNQAAHLSRFFISDSKDISSLSSYCLWFLGGRGIVSQVSDPALFRLWPSFRGWVISSPRSLGCCGYGLDLLDVTRLLRPEPGPRCQLCGRCVFSKLLCHLLPSLLPN